MTNHSQNPPPSLPKQFFHSLPNFLTLTRIFAIPTIVFFLYGQPTPSEHLWAAIIFGTAFWTDFFDGFLARKLKQITPLGKVMDPMADKLMVIAALIMLVDLRYVNVVVVILLISREVAVSALRSLAGAEGVQIPSLMSGRIKVFGEGFGIGFLMLGSHYQWFGIPWMEVGRILLYIGLGLALWSGCLYFKNYLSQGKAPSSKA